MKNVMNGSMLRRSSAQVDQSNNGSIAVENPVQEKSYSFAVDTVKFCWKIQKEKKEYILTKQLIKSGTSVGANIEEAQRPQSRADFISKMSIALKEAYESRFWLRLMRDTELVPASDINPRLTNLEHVIRLLGAITSSSRKK